MADEKNIVEKNQAILDALNAAIENGPWDKAVFFQAMRTKLIEIRERFKQEALLEAESDQSIMPSTLFGRIAKRSGVAEVYVLLYCADGNNIYKWENVLRSVASHVVSRPIYKQEKDAKAALRAASNKLNEGYVSIFIHEEDIIPPDQERSQIDRYGHEIINVKDGVVRREIIHRFVHISGIYEFKGDKLIWQSAADFLA